MKRLLAMWNRAINILSLLVRKLRRKGVFLHIVFTCYGYIMWSCLNLILFIVWHFKKIKLILVQSYGIGHLAYNTDIFLRQSGVTSSRETKVSYLGVAGNPVANQQLLNMYKRKFSINQNNVVYKLLEPLYTMKKTSYFESLWHYHDTAYPYWNYVFDKDSEVLNFTPAEEEKGKSILSGMGVAANSWFICFHARDPCYMGKAYSRGDWSYHNFRDCDIKNYLKATKYIDACGGFAIRMGEHVEEELPELKESGVVDYAINHRSDFGDIYFPAKAKFFLGNTAGIFLVSTIFRVPVALANFVPLEIITPFGPGDLFVPKKIWSIEKKRFLTFREIFESGIGRWQFGEKYTGAGLEVIENTSEEILDLAREMNERLDGIFESTEEDEELQRAFHSLIKPNHLCYGTPVRMGTKFLRENRELLELSK